MITHSRDKDVIGLYRWNSILKRMEYWSFMGGCWKKSGFENLSIVLRTREVRIVKWKYTWAEPVVEDY